MVLRKDVEAPSTLSDFLKDEFNLSSRLINELKRNKAIFVGKKRRHLDYQLSPGEKVVVHIDREENTYPSADIPIDIIYEDEALLVINKQAGYSVHPAGGSAFTTILHGVSHLQKMRGENYKIRFVNRLDRDTSGVLIVAKNKYIHHQMSEGFIRHDVEKIYQCLIHGELRGETKVEAPIAMSADGVHRETVTGGKASITLLKPLEGNGDWSLIEAQPISGRTHQIRVHLKHLGLSIHGDELYGVTDLAPRMMLHCISTTIRHPLSGEELRLEAALPVEFIHYLHYLQSKE